MKRLVALAAVLASSFVALPVFAEEADKAQEKYVEPAKEGKGFVAQLGTSFVVPVGKAVDVPGGGVTDFVGPGERVELRLGYYFTPHFGAMIGAAGSYNGTSDCSGDDKDCGAFTLQIPLVVQYAFEDRKRGFYVETGVELVNYYGFFNKGTVGSFQDNFGELRGAVGYRLPFAFLKTPNAPSRTSFDFSLFAEGGQFTHASVETADGSVDGDVVKRAVHVTFGFGLAYHFTP